MKKLLLATTLLALSMTSHSKTDKIPKTIEGCTSILDENLRSPEGSSQVCFFKNGTFLTIGFGFMNGGVYEIDKEKITFTKPDANIFLVESSYDPRLTGTDVKFNPVDFIYEANSSNLFISFDGSTPQQVTTPINHCKQTHDTGNITFHLDKLNNLTFYDIMGYQSYRWDYQIPTQHNQINVLYLNNDYSYRPGSQTITFKNNKLYFTDWVDGHITHEILPLNTDDELLQPFIKSSDKSIETLRAEIKAENQNKFEFRNEDKTLDNPDYFDYDPSTNLYSLKKEFYDEAEVTDNDDGRMDRFRKYYQLSAEPQIIENLPKALSASDKAQATLKQATCEKQ